MIAGRKRQACVRNYANIFELVERNICIFDAFVVFDNNSFYHSSVLLIETLKALQRLFVS